MFRLLISFIFFVCFAVSMPSLASPDGERLYNQNCVACHGYDGKGGMGIPLSLPDFLTTASNDYLVKTIRNGRPGRVMPAFKSLADNEVEAIVDYIRKWSDSIPPKYSLSPVDGDAVHGKQLYMEYCAECHGESGKGGEGTGVTMSRPRSQPILAPALNNRGFLISASDEMIKNTLIKGRKGTPMASYIKKGLTEKDIEDVVAFVRSFETQARDIKEDKEIEPAVIIKESPYSVEETVSNLINAIGSINFRLIRVQNLDSGLTEEKNEDRGQVIVYSCNFNILNEALKLDPRVGLFLPCRITVSEQGDKVLVMYANPKRMNEIYNNSELDSMCNEMKTVYEDMIDEALL